ncbi:MAG: hypothetical protein NC339_04210 [Muribaculaceae bacterium]|nr:hypothetical protein [Muribaculaceae bacterium]
MAEHFLKYFCIKEGIEPITLTKAAKDALVEHEWSGNNRELFAVVTRAAQESDKKRMDENDLNLHNFSTKKESESPVSVKSKLKREDWGCQE